jgi:hypothetical protein
VTWGIEAFQITGKPVSQEVLATTIQRVAAACRRLDLDTAAVLGHREIDPAQRSDPVGVDMDVFRAEVAGLLRKKDVISISDSQQIVRFNSRAAIQMRAGRRLTARGQEIPPAAGMPDRSSRPS